MSKILRVAAIVAAAAVPMLGQEGEKDWQERMKALETQNQEILKRLEKSEATNASLNEELNRVKVEQQHEKMSEALETTINSLSNDDTAVTWSKLTKSGNPIQFYGYVRMDMYYDSARLNNVIVPIRVLPEDGVATDDNDDQFAFDSRLTRIGMNINAGHIGQADVTGKIEIDFANFPAGVAESRETLRMRLGYINIDFGAITLRFGQDWDIISPIFPSVNYEMMMWNAGNLGDRRPMAQFIWDADISEDTQFSLKIGAGLTGAVDNNDLDAGAAGITTERDGFDSGHPHAQIRAGIVTGSWVEKKKIEFGVYGAIGGLEYDRQYNGEDEYTTWLVGLDLNLPLFGGFGLRGEFFFGDALSDFRGGIAQAINTTSGEEIASLGGWGEFYWVASDEWKFHIGGTIDDPRNGDLNATNPDLNWSMYVGTVYTFGGGLKTGLDVIFWETQYKDSDLGNAVRVNMFIQLDF